ncbi:DUF4129 domain-containing protein [Halovulum dunhuangense]|uniref:DUF4129 domain-containing protein n=1 Tax=Halovulum dunhuangense TaxID=1505036 RepID=A0A849L5R4_9RHOB|nr:DUF4129 domain-containing protein [Halovulum dunhuangense]NNU81522.1 DUF4129 domain-containing protein [Halovulum dunhuangense]
MLLWLAWPGAVPSATPDATSRITPYSLERNADYDRRTRFSRLQTELVYVQSRTGEIPVDLETLRPAAQERGAGLSALVPGASRAVLVGLALVALVLLVLRRERLLALLRVNPASARTSRHAASAVAQTDGNGLDPALIARLRGMADRRAALVELLEAALAAAATANGVRFGPSETARDFLRRLPRDWPHLQDLRWIVMTEELVQFGGRPLREARFLDCLERAAPILRLRGTAT